MIRSIPRPRWNLPRSLAALAAFALTVAPARGQDSWDAIYMGGAKVGFVHTWVEKAPDKGRVYNRVRLDTELRFKRGDDESVIKLKYGTIETLDGEVLRLDTRTQAGQSQDLRVHGDVINHRMKLTMEGTGQSEHRILPWSPDVRGPYGAEQSMARNPMKEHEKRPLRLFVPELNKIADAMLEARSIEPIPLGDGAKHPLLRVDVQYTVDGTRRPEYDARLYVDPEGQVLKTEQDVMGGMVSYRTTKEAALASSGPVKFDLIHSFVVKVPRKIPDADRTRDVKYRLTLKDAVPTAKIFPADARQSLSNAQDGDGGAVLEVKTAGPLDGEPFDGEVGPEYLKANALVTSDDIRVRSLAKQVTRGIDDPWLKATAINKWVNQNIDKKDFKTAFAAASEVARNLTGDCTEHSVLAAAMCRAVGVPSRVVVGLIYVDNPLGGFGYHMWDEVFVNRRWVAIDPSFGQTSVDAVHIKLSESSLEGVAPFEAFLPVVSVVGKLSIEPIEIR